MAKKGKEEIVNDASRYRADQAAAKKYGVKWASDGPMNADGTYIEDKAGMRRWNDYNKTQDANLKAKLKAEAGFKKRDESAARRKVSNVSGGMRSRGYVKDGKYIPTSEQTVGYRKVLRDQAMPTEAKRDAIAAMRNKLKKK